MAPNFYQSILPTCAVSTLLGIFPMFPVKIKGKVTLYTSKFLLSITFIHAFLYTLCVVSMFNEIFKTKIVEGKYYSNDKKDTIINIGVCIELYSGIAIFYAIYATSFLGTSRIESILLKFHRIDSLLENVTKRNPRSPSHKIQYSFINLGFLVALGIIGVQYYSTKVSNMPPMIFTVWIALGYPSFGTYFSNFRFSFHAYLIYKRNKIINESLCDIGGGSLSKYRLFMKNNFCVTVIPNKNAKEKAKILYQINVLSKAYSILSEIVTNIKINYTIQMILCISHIFFILAYTAFYYYWMHKERPFSAACWLSWGALKLFEILQITITCHLASREAEITGRKIHKILIHNRNKEIQERLMEFSQQVLHEKFTFTLAGLFNIDATLLFNIVGSSSTYIVILIQFQEAAAPPDCLVYGNGTITH